MYVVQILLPVFDNMHKPFPQEKFISIQQELTESFGGITSFVRSPAIGLWKENDQKTVRDEIIIFEIMTEKVDQPWWKQYREHLCRLFMQKELIIRASEIQLL
jgi:hypothetical protein